MDRTRQSGFNDWLQFAIARCIFEPKEFKILKTNITEIEQIIKSSEMKLNPIINHGLSVDAKGEITKYFTLKGK